MRLCVLATVFSRSRKTGATWAAATRHAGYAVASRTGLRPRGLDPVHGGRGIVVALARPRPARRRSHRRHGDRDDALWIPHGERIVGQVLAEADLHVLERAMVLTTDRHRSRRRGDAQALQLLDDGLVVRPAAGGRARLLDGGLERSEEHTSELQSHSDLVCRLL